MSSASTSSQVSYSRWYMSQVIALRASGRLKVSVTIALSRSTMTCSLAVAFSMGTKSRANTKPSAQLALLE